MSRQRDRCVMIFSHDDARRKLLQTGRVLTARAERKSDRPVWITDERGGTKICDAYRQLVGEFTNGQFHEFAQSTLYTADPRYVMAGFDSAAAWLQAVKELQGGELPQPVYVHEVLVEAAGVPQKGCTTGDDSPNGRQQEGDV